MTVRLNVRQFPAVVKTFLLIIHYGECMSDTPIHPHMHTQTQTHTHIFKYKTQLNGSVVQQLTPQINPAKNDRIKHSLDTKLHYCLPDIGTEITS